METEDRTTVHFAALQFVKSSAKIPSRREEADGSITISGGRPAIAPHFSADFSITFHPDDSTQRPVYLSWGCTVPAQSDSDKDRPYSEVEAEAFAVLCGQISALAADLQSQLASQQAAAAEGASPSD
ncbi:hypothetical protein [uncultured Roseovarius sp.]|uniref:hypothetical protein n=1 Tax=uncultured Roseovarius sp. TaxID=293344 RepID=UPI0030DC8D32|tara:strand:- start:428 stop:808 length:381 start_codon:yes stop_codon:yes gene_type:complete